MHSPATSVATTPVPTPSITPTTTPATSNHQHEQNDTPDHLPTRLLVLTNDFHLDTFFNLVWMSGPNVFSFAKDGTVVRPEVYSLEPYPGYYVDRTRRLEPVNASHFQGFSTQDSKPWKNVAITEQDDAEFAAIQATVREYAMSEWRYDLYGNAQWLMPGGEEPELVYTWPPSPLEQ